MMGQTPAPGECLDKTGQPAVCRPAPHDQPPGTSGGLAVPSRTTVPQPKFGDPMLLCLVKGIKASKSKPGNYTKLATVHQGPQENPTAFLGRLQRVLMRHAATIRPRRMGG